MDEKTLVASPIEPTVEERKPEPSGMSLTNGLGPLVERLRAISDCDAPYTSETLDEAADALERMEKDISNHYHGILTEQDKTIAALRHDLEHRRNEIAALRAELKAKDDAIQNGPYGVEEVSALRAENERLKAAGPWSNDEIERLDMLRQWAETERDMAIRDKEQCQANHAETIAALRTELNGTKQSLDAIRESNEIIRAENEAQKQALADQLTARKHNEAENERLRAEQCDKGMCADTINKLIAGNDRLRAALSCEQVAAALRAVDKVEPK